MMNRRWRLWTAVVVAGIGVGAAAWTITARLQRPRATFTLGASDHEGLMAELGVTPDEVTRLDPDAFTRLEGAEDSDDIRRVLENRLLQRAAGLEPPLDVGQQRSLAADAALFITAMASGDLDRVLGAVVALGGQPPQTDEQWERLRSNWRYASDRVRFLAAAPADACFIPGFPVSGSTRALEGLLELRRAGLRLGMRLPAGPGPTPTHERFPALIGWDADPASEAWCAILPVQLESVKMGRTRLGFIAAVMAHESASDHWQPAYIILNYDLEHARAFSSERAIDDYADRLSASLWIQ